jgi:hypothetical protein
MPAKLIKTENASIPEERRLDKPRSVEVPGGGGLGGGQMTRVNARSRLQSRGACHIGEV